MPDRKALNINPIDTTTLDILHLIKLCGESKVDLAGRIEWLRNIDF